MNNPAITPALALALLHNGIAGNAAKPARAELHWQLTGERRTLGVEPTFNMLCKHFAVDNWRDVRAGLIEITESKL